MANLNVSELLGLKGVDHTALKTSMGLIHLSEKGITKKSIYNLAKWYGIPVKEIASLIHISDRTINRYSLKKKLEISISEHILQLTRVGQKGMEVFEDRGKFLLWLNSPSIALGGKTPMSYLNTCLGVEMVINELIRMEYGVYA